MQRVSVALAMHAHTTLLRSARDAASKSLVNAERGPCNFCKHRSPRVDQQSWRATCFLYALRYPLRIAPTLNT
jgi:hypothetical protein